ncbi:unnamed protein product [Prunus armeniaca]
MVLSVKKQHVALEKATSRHSLAMMKLLYVKKPPVVSHPGIGFAVARFLFTLGPLSALTVLFLGTHEHFSVGHPSWDCSSPNSLNFGIPMTPKASS